MKSHSEIPRDVVRFMNGISDELGFDRDYWWKREKQDRTPPEAALVLMLALLRLRVRYEWNTVSMSEALPLSRGMLYDYLHKIETLTIFEPELKRACGKLEGYQAGKFILHQFSSVTRLCLGKGG